MTRSHENRCFRRFQKTRDPRHLGKVFDAVAPELLRVAGHLSNGDRELTQDALQATFLTAIEQQDRYDVERDVRPWLLGILANHVRKERRRTVKARGKELVSEPLQVGQAPAQQAELTEFGAVAKDAMKRLPSPFREVIVLHLQHGLTAKEIGDALARPAGTVRTQVVRGMEKLRALLPAGFTAAALGMVLTPGPILAAVRQKVLASLPAAAVAGGSSSLVLFSWRLVAMVAIGVGVALSVFLFPWFGSDPAPATMTPEPASVATAAHEVDDSQPRELVADLPFGSMPIKASEPPEDNGPNMQDVEFVVDYARDGKPAANVPVAMRLDGVVKQWRTDEFGKLRIELPWPGLYEAYVLGTNARSLWSWHDGERRKPVQVVKMTIEPGMNLDLRVVGPNGQPVVGANVEASHGNQVGGMFSVIGKTDADGRFRRKDIANRYGQVRAWAPGYVPSTYRKAVARVDETCEVELKLPAAGLVARGRVVDETGKPLAGARIALVQQQQRTRFPQYFTSAEDGTFPLDTLHRGVSILVGVHQEEEKRRGEVRFTHDGTGEPTVELRLTHGATVSGTLTNANGRPYAGVNICARSRPHGVQELPFLETWTRTAADGSYRIEALVPGRYVLETERVADHPVEVREGEQVEWNPVRQEFQPCKFQLLDALGNPLAGWVVSLIPPGSDWPSGGCLLGEAGRPQQYAATDWAFPAGSYYRLMIHKRRGKNEQWFKDYARLPNLVTPPLLVGVEQEIRVPANVTSMHDIGGEVVDSEGNPVGNAKVTLYGAFGRYYGAELNVDKATGAFTFEGFPPGRYSARITVPGRPSIQLPKLNVGRSPSHSLGRIVVADTGRVVVSVAGDVVRDGMQLKVADQHGSTFTLRKQKDGTWRSGKLYHGEYELRGFTKTARVVAQKLALDGDERRVTAEFADHEATRVIVELGPDYPSNANSWSGTVRTMQQGRTTSSRRVNRSFYGNYQSRMEFFVQLPPGEQDVRVTCWRKRVGIGQITVPPQGGGTVTVVIE